MADEIDFNPFDPETEEVIVEEKKPKKVSKKKKFQVKSVAINAWIFQGPTEVSRGLTRTRRGNLMTVLDEEDDWYKVEFPRRDESVVGFIRKEKVEKI